MNRNQTDFLDKLDALFREFNIEAVPHKKPGRSRVFYIFVYSVNSGVE